jgi:hypothetical protein
MCGPKTLLRFAVEFDGELGAGLRPFSDEVAVMVRDGFADEEQEKEFADHMRDAIAEWFDGAHVAVIR